MTVHQRLGSSRLLIVTTGGAIVAEHTVALAGAGRLVRLDEHAVALEASVLAGFTIDRPCRRKANRPPGAAAQAAAAVLRGDDEPGGAVVIDLAARYGHLDGKAAR